MPLKAKDFAERLCDAYEARSGAYIAICPSCRRSGFSVRDGHPGSSVFARIHKTLRVTPAMEAGVSDHVWSLEEIVGLLDLA